MNALNRSLQFQVEQLQAENAALKEVVSRVGPPSSQKEKFIFVNADDFSREFNEDWRIKGVIPARGVGIIYGESQTFKSFIILHIGESVIRGDRWCSKKVNPGDVVYIVAEGAAGIAKRIIGLRDVMGERETPYSLFVMKGAPNLGTEKGDLAGLISAIEAVTANPALVILDTLSKCLGGGDENGLGMQIYQQNCELISAKFNTFVLSAHHSGYGGDDRPRGHSSLKGGVDFSARVTRPDKTKMVTRLMLEKEKDEKSQTEFDIYVERRVVGFDADGDEVSTLAVVSVEEAEPAEPAPAPLPRSSRTFLDAIRTALRADGQLVMPRADGRQVRAVGLDKVRRVFDSAAPAVGDTERKRADARRKSAKRALDDLIARNLAGYAESAGVEWVWLTGDSQ